MTTDFRALCNDLSWVLKNTIRIICREDGTKHISITANPIAERAALADEPAAPAPPTDGETVLDSCNRGLLPMIVSATGDPDEPELERIICSSISGGADYLNGMPRELSLQRITAEGSVFARYIQGPRSPELTINSTEHPAPPADGEVAELVAWLQEEADDYECIGLEDSAARCNRAAELLQRQVQVPVSERPWEREGWCDAEGKCWICGKVEGDWRLINPTNSGVPNLKYCFTHCLPANALPRPGVNNG